MYVFREGRRSVSSDDLRRALTHCLAALANTSTNQQALLVETLLRAGELECALADADLEHDGGGEITEALAARLLVSAPFSPNYLLQLLERLPLPERLTVSIPEGFAYYALHPLQYSELAEALPLNARHAAVVGIRSIGTTLSAVVAAALRAQGIVSERITVRPEGHPFNRVTRFSGAQRQWVKRQQSFAAYFFVVDEGPGLSGSSLLSVGEALVEAGVPRKRIVLLCAHQPNSTALCSQDAAKRVEQFNWRAVPRSTELPANASTFLGGGRWREWLGYNKPGWPASWTAMERAKFASPDGRHLYKFEGLGHYGSAVVRRLRVLGDAGLSPEANEDDGTGYVRYPLLRGTRLQVTDVSPHVLAGMGRYCALRADLLPAKNVASCERNLEELELMTRTNLDEEFGIAAGRQHSLELVKPVIADGRMQSWEWIIADDKLLKFDAASHGDDHFFPGPTDIAWDLAGAVVECAGFATESATREVVLRAYHKQSSDDASRRLPAYLLAYSAFRLGYCKMATEAMRGSEEEERMKSAYLRYRDFAARLIARREAA